MSVVGPNNAGSGVDNSAYGTASWSNTNSIFAAESTPAIANPTNGNDTHYLVATNFGFGLPSGSTIAGIVPEVRRMSNLGTVTDARVRLVKGGTIQSTDADVLQSWGTSYAYATYGGAADLWGTSWSYADINATNFGLAIAGHTTNVTPDTSSVDHVRMSIYYTLPTSSGISSTTLFIGGHKVPVGRTDIDLYIKGLGAASGGMTLYTSSCIPASGGLTLYEKGLGAASGGDTLFIDGGAFASGNMPLYECGYQVPTPLAATLYTFGVYHTETGLPLFMMTDDIPGASGGMSLSLFGTSQSGVFRGTDLYIYSDASGQMRQAGIPLSLLGASSGRDTTAMNLWVEGIAYAAQASVPFTIWNADSGVSLGCSLYVSGQGLTAGAMPAEKAFNLFLARDPANSMPLYTQGPGTPASGNMNLYLCGVLAGASGVPLSLRNVVGGSNRGVRVYTHGW